MRFSSFYRISVIAILALIAWEVTQVLHGKNLSESWELFWLIMCAAYAIISAIERR
jgi:hypothetical protein